MPVRSATLTLLKILSYHRYEQSWGNICRSFSTLTQSLRPIPRWMASTTLSFPTPSSKLMTSCVAADHLVSLSSTPLVILIFVSSNGYQCHLNSLFTKTLAKLFCSRRKQMVAMKWSLAKIKVRRIDFIIIFPALFLTSWIIYSQVHDLWHTKIIIYANDVYHKFVFCAHIDESCIFIFIFCWNCSIVILWFPHCPLVYTWNYGDT